MGLHMETCTLISLFLGRGYQHGEFQIKHVTYDVIDATEKGTPMNI